jgi:hypothetical protein
MILLPDNVLFDLLFLPLVEKYILEDPDVSMQTWLNDNNINIKVTFNDNYRGDDRYVQELELPDDIEERMQLILTHI